MKLHYAVLVACALTTPIRAEEPMAQAPLDKKMLSGFGLADSYPPIKEVGRVTYRASIAQRGTSISIEQKLLEEYCGDVDGCEFRLGMFHWDGTGRTASRAGLLYYNRTAHTWRASTDLYGTDADATVQHVMHAWSCYFTDGEYRNWAGTDTASGFGLLSWNEYAAECHLTIAD